MSRAATIADDRIRAVVRPDLGGGLARLDRRRGDGWDPVLRPLDGADALPGAAFGMAMNLLVPFSNRLSDGLRHDGARHRVPPNVEGERYPLHGDGWLSAWVLERAEANAARLSHRGAIGPWTYRATVDYRVEDGALDTALAVANEGDALPFGLGLHPWFVRRPGATLHAPAAAQWLEGDGHLPTERIGLADPRAFDARSPAPLPHRWINAGFDGWDGMAVLRWPGDGGVRLTAQGAQRCVLHSPGAASAFFCVEPVTHAIDAPALPGGAAAHGMAVLAPGATVRLACRIEPFEEDAP